MRVVHINSVINTGSTGRIIEEIGNVLLDNGHESFVAYGRKIGNLESRSALIKIGNRLNNYWHGLNTLLFDSHGFVSKIATKNLIKELERIDPDVIALYNLHGYYIHVGELFEYLQNRNKPVVWTLFDCWAFTGHCTYFDNINCLKWQTECYQCPKFNKYPTALFDNSRLNFQRKKQVFTSLNKLEIITHSKWLSDLVSQSFLKSFLRHTIPSAVNTNLFQPVFQDLTERYGLRGKKVILGCANTWTDRKGFKDFLKLASLCNSNFVIVLIGVSVNQIEILPDNILGIKKTESIEQLSAWYSLATVFVNPTYMDNFPTTNIEALACGTPVVTYNTGGSPESIDSSTGIVIEVGDIQGIWNAIIKLSHLDQVVLSQNCRNRALRLYDKQTRFLDYLQVFERALIN